MAEGNPAPAPALYWPPETPMEVTTRMSGTVTVVNFGDRLTAKDGAAAFRETVRALIESGRTQIVLNCDAFIDDAGISGS